jgi:hypothetical protein
MTLVAKTFAPLFLVLALLATISAQNKCTAKLAGLPPAPELSGFRLGMSFDQVKARVPQVAFGRTNDLGLSKTSINPYFDPTIDKTNFEDVRTVSLDFVDGRVTSLWLGYEGSFRWKTVDEFVKGIAQSLRVTGDWTVKGRGQQLKCADFELSVSMIAGGPSLRILDLAADETLVARRQAKEDAADAAANAHAAAESTSVIGDARNKIFYSDNCPSLKAVPENKRITFPSQEDAEKAGYKRAATCP